MSLPLVSPEASEALRERVMRLSYHMASPDLDLAISTIFDADKDNEGQFSEGQYLTLASLADKVAQKGRMPSRDRT